MNNSRPRPPLALLPPEDEPEPSDSALVNSEFDELLAASKVSRALGTAVRRRVDELVKESIGFGQATVFPTKLVQEIRVEDQSLPVLFVGTRVFEYMGRRFVVNAELNGVRVRDAVHLLIRDGAGRPCRASRALGSSELLHRVHAFAAIDGTLLRFFVHEAGHPALLRQRFFEIVEGTEDVIDVDIYEDHLRGLRLMR